jgi:ankyrin repeat protein
MSAELVFVYACLIAFVIFVIWLIRTNSINQVYNAVSDGNVEKLREYLNQGVDAKLDHKWNSLLFIAANKGHKEIADLLLTVGANVNLEGINSPLYAATNKGYKEIVEMFILHGADVNQERGNNSLLCLAANRGYKEIAELLIEGGVDINYGLEKQDSANALLEAMIEKHSEIAEALIYKGAKTGLHCAALQGDTDSIIKLLTKENDSINSKRYWMTEGILVTPLHLAAIAGFKDTVEILLNNGADIEGVETNLEEKSTPLFQAVSHDHTVIVNLLIDRGANINRSAALYLATCQNNIKMVEILIAKGADVNYQDSTIDSPLHKAAELGRIEIARLLLSNNANANAESRCVPRNPLHLAAKGCHLEMAELLIQYGAKVNRIDGSLSLATPLDYARDSRCTELITLLKSYGGVELGLLD